MHKKIFITKTVLLPTSLALLLVLAHTSPAMAKDKTNKKAEAISDALSKSEKKETTPKAKTLKKTKAPEKEAQSFRRFQLAYECMWLKGKYIEGFGWWAVPGGAYSDWLYKYKLKTRLDVLKGAFYFTPKTYIEGYYATGLIKKHKPGSWYVNMPGTEMSLELATEGNSTTIWSADLCQNIYTHKASGLGLDLFAGYANYSERIRIYANDGQLTTAGDSVFGANRKYFGPHMGMKLKAPFSIPEFPKNPFLFKLSASYTPLLYMKQKDEWMLPLIDPYYTTAIKGTAMEAHTSLSWQINRFFSLEVGYNLYEFIYDHGDYGVFPGFGGTISVQTNNYKSRTLLHGPSASITATF